MFYKSAINVKNIGNDGVGTDFVQLEQLKATCGILFIRGRLIFDKYYESDLPQLVTSTYRN